MTKRHLLLLAWLMPIAFTSTALAQKVGPEFQVNQSTTGYERAADVASDSMGNFMVVWHNTGYYGHGVFGRTYDSDGNPLSDQFRVGESGYPAIASTNDNFIVVWGDEDHSILGQLYDGGGNPLGEQLRISDARSSPRVASDASGNFVVVHFGAGRRFDSDGNPLTDEFPLPGGAVASDANGNFVVAWTKFLGPYGGYDVFGRRYDDTGKPIGDEFQVNTYTTSYQKASSVATTLDGHFLVVWASGDYSEPGPDGSDKGVSGQLYDPTGTRVGGEFQVNQHTNCNQGSPDVAADKAGNFVVVWQDGYYHDRDCFSRMSRPARHPKIQEDVFQTGVFGRRYDVQGRPLTDEFQVNTETGNTQAHPSVASASSGSFVVVWENYHNPEDSGYGVFGQRFSTDCQASVAVEGDVQPPGGTLRLQVHIAHHRPKTVTVPWELRLLDGNGQQILRHATEPHTFEPGDVVDKSVELRLPDDLAPGTYTLELAISGMVGTKGAATTFRVVRAE